jgi:hypothetical protein
MIPEKTASQGLTRADLYGWVSEDAELRALAGWRAFCPSEVAAGE